MSLRLKPTLDLRVQGPFKHRYDLPGNLCSSNLRFDTTSTDLKLFDLREKPPEKKKMKNRKERKISQANVVKSMT